MAISTYTVPSDRIVHETKVDFTQRSIQKTLHVVQYDKSLPIIAVQLFQNGSTYTLPADADVKIRWGKKDHTFIYKSVLGCDSSRQIVYFDVDEQMTYYNGPCNPILELIISGNKAGSSYIPFEIDRNPVQNTDIESHSEYPDLEAAVEEAEAAADRADEDVQKIEDYSDDSEAWAVGTIDGEEVPETDPRYHNNSKWYAGKSEESATLAESSASTASTSETNAANSASAASTSETNAANSATESASSAKTSKDYAGAASNYSATATNAATDSRKYSEKSAESAALAASSASAASTSETNAESFATASKESEESVEAAISGFDEKVATAKSEIETNKNNDIEEINSTKDSAVAAVEAKKTESVTAVQEVIESIPEDYSNLVKKVDKLEDTIEWNKIIDIVKDGKASNYYSIADQMQIPYTYNGTTYDDCPHDIVDFSDDVILNDQDEEETVHAITLEWHYTIPLGLSYDPDEALAEISSNGLPAGKYCVCIDGDSWGSKNGLYYSFTLTNDLTEGMQLKPSGSYNSSSSTSFTMRIYANGKTFTPTYEVTMTLESSLPSDATYLGKYGGTDYDSSVKDYFKPPYTKDGTDRILNHYHAVYLGLNNWKWSLYRQWLNGDENWTWESQHPCDRAPSNYASLKGFLSGYSDEFKAILKPRKNITYRNTVMFDDGYDTTYDKIFLHSMANINVDGFTSQQNTGGLEGNAWAFYQKLAEGQSNLNSNGTFKAWSTYEVLKKYALNAKTSAQYVFARSAYRSHGGFVLDVFTSGYVDLNAAYDGFRCLPACIIPGSYNINK